MEFGSDGSAVYFAEDTSPRTQSEADCPGRVVGDPEITQE